MTQPPGSPGEPNAGPPFDEDPNATQQRRPQGPPQGHPQPPGQPFQQAQPSPPPAPYPQGQPQPQGPPPPRDQPYPQQPYPQAPPQPQGQPYPQGQPQGQPYFPGQPYPPQEQPPGHPTGQPTTPFGQDQPAWAPPGGPYPPPSGAWEQLGPPLPPQRRRSRRLPILAAVATAALIGGGTATYLAVSQTDSGFKGAASPQQAVTSLVNDLNKSDLLGVLDHLAPAERASLLDPVKESISQAKRLHLLKSSADGSHLSGVDITAKNVTFDKSDDTINDHVRVAKLTGGTITVNTDLSKVAFTDEYLKLAFPHGLPADSKSSQTVNLADVVRENGEPIRIAAQRVNGKWYPSILYTMADSIVHENGMDNPGPSDYVAPKGADTAEDAVKQAVVAISKTDIKRLIELASPDELRVLHDYGGLILNNAEADPTPPFDLKDLQLVSKDVNGGKRVSLKSITVGAKGHSTTVAVSGNCLEITVDGDYRKFCADELIKQINAGSDRPLTAEETAALGRLARGIPNIGVDVTSTGGQWYVNPVRTYLDLTNALLEPLNDNDLIVLLKLITVR